MTVAVGGGVIRVAGEHGLLVETGSLAVSHRLDALLRARRPAGVTEVVPGPETVLVVAPRADPARLRPVLESLLADAARAALGPHATPPGGSDATPPGGRDTAVRGGRDTTPSGDCVVTVPVVYDGEDLPSVADLAGLTVEELIARHTGRELVVGWLGFAPGFAYLIGLDPALHVPRLATPRTSVPPGAVAVAGPYSAIYPSASPGGWRLLGHTSLRVWDVTAEPPSLLRPGTRVRFEGS
jgi:KipI family sensor histidine kinase inhibitor